MFVLNRRKGERIWNHVCNQVTSLNASPNIHTLLCNSFPDPVFCFPHFQLPIVNRGSKIKSIFSNYWHHLFLTSNHQHRHGLMTQDHSKQMILLLIWHIVRRTIVAWCYIAMPISFTSLHLITYAFYLNFSRRVSTRGNLRERPHSHNFYYSILIVLFYY